ncbi:MAG: hypothetical protein ACP5GX_12090 [Anaerolineae bacterium]
MNLRSVFRLLLIVLVAPLLSGAVSRASPALIVEDSVAQDFESLALETWGRFLATFEARWGCFGDVRLRASSALDRRATYNPRTATVTVRVPGTEAMLQSALIHEWAHHVEYQCKAHEELRADFLIAQGYPPGTPWRADVEGGAVVPSEEYAEATIAVVLGRRSIPTGARVTTEGLEVIAAWAWGGRLSP